MLSRIAMVILITIAVPSVASVAQAKRDIGKTFYDAANFSVCPRIDSDASECRLLVGEAFKIVGVERRAYLSF
jgi:hypothetical protein